MVLPDVLAEGLVVVFCSTAPPKSSLREQVYYAGRGNKFWSVLYRTKMTPRQLRPEEFNVLLAHDIGLTDLAQSRATADREPADGDFDVAGLTRKLIENAPAIVAFNGKEAAKRTLRVDNVGYGPHALTIGSSRVYVLTSTASTANDHWDDRWWHELAAEVRKLRKR